MRECQFCNGPLDIAANGLAFQIHLGGFDPAWQAHDACAEGARGMQRDLSLHRLYCHLDDCEWQPREWRARPLREVHRRTETELDPLPPTRSPNIG